MFKKRNKPAVTLTIVIATAGALTLASNTANAEEWYAGGSFGQSTMKDAGSALVGSSLDDSDNAWKVYGGYQFHPNVGVEFGYINFGKFEGSGRVSGLAASDDWKATGINVSALGTLPLPNQFSLFGKIGFTRWEVKDTFSLGPVSGSPKENGVDLSVGIGAQYAFTKQLVGRVEYELFKDVGDDNTTGQSDIDVISIGVVFKF